MSRILSEQEAVAVKEKAAALMQVNGSPLHLKDETDESLKQVRGILGGFIGTEWEGRARTLNRAIGDELAKRAGWGPANIDW